VQSQVVVLLTGQKKTGNLSCPFLTVFAEIRLLGIQLFLDTC
jgi:hypothetical protein